MAKANIHRRSTLEEVYPPDAFARDAAQNGRVPNTVLNGVRILSAPDAAGDFDFERGKPADRRSSLGQLPCPSPPGRQDPRRGTRQPDDRVGRR
jgi:hypothetical protein